MGSPNIRDFLTAFSPSRDFFAISTGDGRIKIWDTVKGQIQTEFADIESSEVTNMFAKKQEGHLSMDYTCMKWISMEKKKKRKLGTSILVLGTGGGDVLALDVSAGQLKWRACDCHPGGVTAISFPKSGRLIYTAGADGMACELDTMSGNLLQKFKASTKGISSMSISSGGEVLATAASQLKIVNCSDHKKLQKFSGHPGPVRCMVFSEDGKYLLSSAVGERYIAVWKLGGSKKQSACCLLAMDHPAVFLESRCIATDADEAGLCVLAISETGVCYFWHGKSIKELRHCKPTKISSDEEMLKKYNGTVPGIFAAKLETVVKPASCHVFLAHGLHVKPSFEKILLQSGTDLKLNSSLDGLLLPISQSRKRKLSKSQNQVTALDRANAEGALLPMPHILDLPGAKSGAKLVVSKDDECQYDADTVTICMEEQLRSMGIVCDNDDPTSKPTFESDKINGINLEASIPQKEIKKTVLSMEPSDACSLLEMLIAGWHSRLYKAKYILPWIYCIMANHHDYLTSQEPYTHLLDSLYKLTKSKGAALNSLLQLCGRLQLVTAQFEKAANSQSNMLLRDEQMEESEDEDVEEVRYGLEDESQTSSDNDD
nr:WD repeat-containing protein 43-like isoform X1 [Ipomoea batatas]